MNYTAVITTINEPTKAVEEISKRVPTIVIGDEKTPDNWFFDNTTYFNGTINGIGFSYAPPVNHYARKNIGYLLAMQQGADCIYDTDDDNIPNGEWKLRTPETYAMTATGEGWTNVYSCFTPKLIWPRGLPLNEINSRLHLEAPENIYSPIQQGLADGDPDVDAIWRMVFGQPINFEWQRSVHLKGVWSPFNSQSTWWFREAFPLLYLPQYCSFRLTDIYRSFVAQRVLWEMGYGVVFHSPSEVFQDRNEHNLMSDFKQEVSGYLHNNEMKTILDGLDLTGDVYENIYECYVALIQNRFMAEEEIFSLIEWIKDCKEILK